MKCYVWLMESCVFVVCVWVVDGCCVCVCGGVVLCVGVGDSVVIMFV